MGDSDADTDFPPQSIRPHTPPDGFHSFDCKQERAIREIQREIGKHRDQLTDGAVAMAKFTISVDNLKVSVDQLTKAVAEREKEEKKPNPLVAAAQDSAVRWAVPVVIVILVWALVSSGIVRIPQAPTQPVQQPAGSLLP